VSEYYLCQIPACKKYLKNTSSLAFGENDEQHFTDFNLVIAPGFLQFKSAGRFG